MSLVKCPECGKEISDKASSCIHCGCPSSAFKAKDDLCAFDDEPEVVGHYLMSVEGDTVCLACKKCGCTDRYNEVCFASVTPQECIPSQDISCYNCWNDTSEGSKITEPTDEQLAEMELKQGSEISHKASYFENKKTQGDGVAKCPNCGSTSITTGQRGFSAFTGFFGAGQTMNRCANCGHRWKPGGLWS